MIDTPDCEPAGVEPERFCDSCARFVALRDERDALRARVAELEAALRGLLEDTQHAQHHCAEGDDCPVRVARKLLEQQP